MLSAKLGLTAEDIVKLDANENPYGPPPEVLKALGSLKFPHIYPDPESRQLRAKLARNHSVPMDQILVSIISQCHVAAALNVCIFNPNLHANSCAHAWTLACLLLLCKCHPGHDSGLLSSQI